MSAIEHDLFIEWMKWLQSNFPSHMFTYDGIVSINDWMATPTKVLLVLKDYNDTCRSGRYLPLNQFNIRDRESIKANVPNLHYHLANSISQKKNWRTWNNAARWVYGLLNSDFGKDPPYTEARKAGDVRNRTANMKKVDVLDLKKQPGTASCSKQMLDDYFKNHQEAYSFLARQVSLYGHLDFVICCDDDIIDHYLRVMKTDILKSQK